MNDYDVIVFGASARAAATKVSSLSIKASEHPPGICRARTALL